MIGRLRKVLVAAVAVTGMAGSAAAQELIGSYVAFLSAKDHYNSNGVRLTEPWQIIRQDRANYHRFGIRDNLDEWDSFFGSINNRAAAEQMLLNGFIPADLAQEVVNNEVVIRVDIYGFGSRGNSLQVTVY